MIFPLKYTPNPEIYRTTPHVKFKKYVKKAIRDKAYIFLMEIKEKHSKLKDISYTKLEIQKYLKSSNKLTDEEKCTLFRFRVREIDVKFNYKNKYADLKCNFCKSDSDDNQYHLLQCEYFINNCENLANNIEIEYEDIFLK